MKFLKAEKIDSNFFCIPDSSLCKVIRQGDITEVRWSDAGLHIGHDPGITRIDKDHYKVRATGEVKTYKKNVDSTGSFIKHQKSLSRTFSNLRSLINTNFTKADITGKKCLFLTLTFAEDLRGAEGNEVLYKQYKEFIRLVNKAYRNTYGKVEYICVVEPQGSGRWHIHSLMKWEGKAPFIPLKELNTLWSYGFSKISLVGKGVKDIDNLGAYLTAYLTDLPYEDLTSQQQALVASSPDSIVEKNGKKYIKGGRLWMYPESMKIYRCSKGMKKPKQSLEYLDTAALGSLTYESAKTLYFEKEQKKVDPLESGASKESPDDLFKITYVKQYYNKNRQESQ